MAARATKKKARPLPEEPPPTLSELGAVAPDEAWTDDRTHTAAAALEAVLAKYRIGQRVKEHQLKRQWPVIVGEFNAQHCHPESIQRKVLMIRVSNAPLRHHLELLKGEILRRAQSVVGEDTVAQVRFGL
jgi:predicted nucleic acid-binding Zn ribbon protein